MMVIDEIEQGRDAWKRSPLSCGGYVNCVCDPQVFLTALSSFFQEICLSTSLLYTSLNTNFSLKSCFRRWITCCSLTIIAMTSAVMNFWCHKLITMVNEKRNSDMENFICNRYGDGLDILNSGNIKICLRFLSYLLNICKMTFYFPR